MEEKVEEDTISSNEHEQHVIFNALTLWVLHLLNELNELYSYITEKVYYADVYDTYTHTHTDTLYYCMHGKRRMKVGSFFSVIMSWVFIKIT